MYPIARKMIDDMIVVNCSWVIGRFNPWLMSSPMNHPAIHILMIFTIVLMLPIVLSIKYHHFSMKGQDASLEII